nr:CAP domain-containing protein [Sinirhodobacter sp. WL0062]
MLALMPVWAAAQDCPIDQAAATRLLDEVNAERLQVGLIAVRPEAALTEAAQDHACDMLLHGYFDHRGRDGSSPKTRAEAAGYRACMILENIAMGQRDPRGVIGDWMNSPGHRNNILNKDAEDAGIAIAREANRPPIYVMVLASPCR